MSDQRYRVEAVKTWWRVVDGAGKTVRSCFFEDEAQATARLLRKAFNDGRRYEREKERARNAR